MQSTNQNHNQAARPILASTLLSTAQAHSKRKPKPASSGSTKIDNEALDGGFRYGEITSIAGVSGTGKTLIAYHAIASHLLRHETNEVAFVDTTGSFSPLHLRNVLAFRLWAQSQQANFQESGYMYEKRFVKAAVNENEKVEQAASMLGRVHIMRVFDFAGVVEAVGEVSDMIERSLSAREDPTAKIRKRRRTEVSDSEDELEEDDVYLPTRSALDNSEQTKPGPCKDGPTQSNGQPGMIVIDAITNVVSSMVAKNQVQGQGLMTSLMRSLEHLTNRHYICTILINAAVGINASSNSKYPRRPEDNVSIFSSTLGKPALGKTFTYLIDTSIFLSLVPKTKEDAAIAFGVRGESSSYGKALILEVLKDRAGSREGRWVAFEILEGFKLVPFHR